MENENVKINESLTSNVLDQNRQKKEINIDSSHLGIVRKIVFEWRLQAVTKEITTRQE